MTNLENLSAKELKVIAKEKWLEFNSNASQKDMLEIIIADTNKNIEYDNSLEDIEDEEILKEKVSWEFTVITPIKRNWKKYNPWDTIFFEEINSEVENLIADKIIEK